LLVLEEAVRRHIPIHVVVPLSDEEFEAASVADLGEQWVASYRRVLSVARTAENTVTTCGFSPGDDWYRNANGAIIDRAREVNGAGPLVALAVQPRSSTGPSVTDDFVERARNGGLPVISIDPGRPLRELPKAFAVMPFGTKTHPATGRKIDCDSVFDRLLVPA